MIAQARCGIELSRECQSSCELYRTSRDAGSVAQDIFVTLNADIFSYLASHLKIVRLGV
jgi:hypothetical protein